MKVNKNDGLLQRLCEDKRYPLGKLIIEKFLDIREYQPFRDLRTAYKLIDKYPAEEFWRQLPCEFRIRDLGIFFYKKPALRLDIYWEEYRRKLATDKRIDFGPVKEYTLEDKPIGENPVVTKKIKTKIEFCR